MGGEDRAYGYTIGVLEASGYTVATLEFDNRELESLSAVGKAQTAIWNSGAAHKVEDICRREGICAVHFHNTFPFASPAVYGAAKRAGSKVIQWIHNYRLICPSGSFFRDGHVCEDCMGKFFAWPGIAHGCYRQSRAATAVVATMQTVHRARGTYRNEIDRFLVYTEFVGRKLEEGGIPAEQISVVPNLVHPDPGAGPGEGGYGAFLGRLTQEKGVYLLMDALERSQPFPFKIVGGGPLAAEVAAFASKHPHVEYVADASDEAVREIISRAEFLVLPSLWYEGGGPLSAVKSLAVGTPLVVPDLGNFPYYVDAGVTGLLFEPGNAGALAAAMANMMADKERRVRMRSAARQAYLRRYVFDAQVAALKNIMQSVLETA